jgi:hypothetical protein
VEPDSLFIDGDRKRRRVGLRCSQFRLMDTPLHHLNAAGLLFGGNA